MHRDVSFMIFFKRSFPSPRLSKYLFRHLSPSFSMAPSTLPRISIPFGFAASVLRLPAFTAASRRFAPFSEQTSTNVAFPALSPMTPQFPQARSAWRGTFILHRRQLDRRPNPSSSSSSIEMPLCWPSFVTMMNWPLSISSLTTSSGSTPNFSRIIFRADTGLTEPPQLRPIIRMLSRLT